MIILINRHGRARLEGVNDFRRFEIVVESPGTTAEQVGAALGELGEMAGDGIAWISEAALIKLADRERDAAWLADFGAMKDYARRFEWVDDERCSIRAHIQWPSPQSGDRV